LILNRLERIAQKMRATDGCDANSYFVSHDRRGVAGFIREKRQTS
jgi:hypothetical protein